MKIIFDNGSGGVGVLYPTQTFIDSLEGTEEEKLIYLADKDLPTGTKYEIVNDADVPSDRTNRDGWQYVSGPNEKTSKDLV